MVTTKQMIKKKRASVREPVPPAEPVPLEQPVPVDEPVISEKPVPVDEPVPLEGLMPSAESESAAEPVPLAEKVSAESASRSQRTGLGPKTSPYTSLPVALRIGSEHREYYVPPDLLQNPGWIASSRSGGEDIYIPDVDKSTGHVLVHYLYTGAYQTLEDTETSLVEEVHTEFKRAVLVYVAATTYEIHGLQHLAEEKIEEFGVEMNIFAIIEAIKEDISKLPSDATWFHDYLGRKAKAAFAEDHTAFIRNDLFGRIDDIAIMRLLAKRVVDIYDNKISSMLSVETEPVSETTEESFTTEETSDEACSVEKSFAAKEAPAEECPREECLAEECPAEKCATVEGWAVAEECATIEECAATEECPVTDECVVAEGCPAEEAPIEETRTQEPSTEELPDAEPKIDMSFDDFGRENPPVFGFPSLSSWTSGWGSKHSWAFDQGPDVSKGKHDFDFDAFNAAPAETIAKAEQKDTEDDELGLSWASTPKKATMKGKKRLSVLVEDTVPEPPPEPEETKEDERLLAPFDSAEVKKESIVEEGLPTPPVPEPEVLIEAPPVDPFTNLKKNSTKKLRLKMRREAREKAKMERIEAERIQMERAEIERAEAVEVEQPSPPNPGTRTRTTR